MALGGASSQHLQDSQVEVSLWVVEARMWAGAGAKDCGQGTVKLTESWAWTLNP